MDLRKTPRYNLYDIEGRQPDEGYIHCRFDFDPNLNGRVVDLGLGGFGIEIHDLTGTQAEKVQKQDTYILTIYFGKEIIMTDVKNVWNRVIFDQGKMFLKGGVAVNIISPEDRLKLSGVIAKIRSNQ
jgi:hypothetical protein